MTSLNKLVKVQDKRVKFRVQVQGKFVGKEIRVIVRGEFQYFFREVDQMGQGALCRRGQVHAAFWGPDVFLDEKAVRACQLRLLFGWVARLTERWSNLLRPDGKVCPWFCVRLCV